VKFRDILLTGTGHRDRRLNRDCPGQTGTYGRSTDDGLLHEKLMHEGSELTFDRCIEICPTAELTKTQARAMSSISSTAAIDAIKA